MSDLQTIIKWISEYGITLIITSVFIYVVIRLLNIFFKYLSGRLGNSNTKHGREAHDKLLDMRTDIGNKIQRLLDDFLANHGGTRIQVMEFSNSNISVAYLPFKYMTCTYEVYQLGLSAVGQKLDHISTSLFTQFFNAFKDKDYLVFDIDDKSTPVGGAMCDMMREEGSKKSLCVMLKTEKGKSIGYVSMKKDIDFTEDDIYDIQSLGDQISVLLSVADN